MMNKNPASVIREALAKGVLFIEAEADVTLKEFGEQLQPPFPCMEELLYDVPDSSSILDSPLLLVQVTRLLCGGFIFAIRWNHTMCDATGLVKLMKAWSKMAHGALIPSTLPVWHRELLSARNPPCVTCTNYEYDEVADTEGTITSSDDMTQRSFFFRPAELAALRRFVPVHLQNCSTFDVLTANIWRCRTIALQPNPKEDMRIMCIMDARLKFNPPIPLGYYGNVLAFSAAISTAQDICNKPLSHALELVMKAKSNLTQEYMRSIADLMVPKVIRRRLSEICTKCSGGLCQYQIFTRAGI
ncbi:benzyl alcohol O-benzoyltransferase-like protein [Tanacetum coccineum]